jgi:hypothetical protein
MNPPNTTRFTFTANGELQARNGNCLYARKLYGPQLWAKPLSMGKAAVLVVNLLDQNITFSLPLADVPFLTANATSCIARSGASCAVRDVWERKDLAPITSHIGISLRSHQSAFFVIG